MSEPLAEARVLIVPDLTAFSATLKTQLAAQIKAVEGSTVAITQKARATSAAAVADEKLAGASVASAEALKLQKAAALEVENVFGAVAVAAKLASTELKEQALAADQAARGLSTAAASAAGLRGAVLASSGPFLAAVVAFEAIKKSVEEASATQEAAARVTKVLGEEGGRTSEVWGKQLAESFGLSTLAALKFEGAIAEVFHNVGLNNTLTQEFSQRLVELSSDVAAFNNADPTQVLRAFQLGLSGNLRGLRQFVPGVTAARVALRAMSDTGKDVKADLTDQELAVARYEVILQAASNQVGAFADRQSNLAVQTRVLKSNIADLADTAGGILVPALSILAKAANDSVKGLRLVAELAKEAAPATEDAAHHTTLFGEAMHGLGVAADFAGPALATALGGELGILATQIDRTSTSTRLMAQEARDLAADPLRQMLSGLLAVDSGLGSLVGPINTIDTLLHFLIDTFQETGQAAQTLGQQLQAALSTAQHQLLDLQFQGASSAAQIANLQRQVEINQEIIRHPGKGGQKAIDEARQARNAAQAQIDSIRAADAADAKAAKNAAEAAAKAAAAAAEADRRAHDQAIQNENESLQFTSDLAHARAQRTKSLVDDLAADRLEVRNIDEKIANARHILDATTREQTLNQLTLEKERANQQIEADREQIAKNIRDRKVDALAAAVNLADLDVQIFEARHQGKTLTAGGVSAEVALLLKENVALEKERQAWKGNTQKQKEITLAIEQNNAQIRELRKTKQENAGLSAQAQFEFLTTQAGFAANLLGNLIPRGVAAGTVGGSLNAAISTQTGPGPAGFATAVHQRDLTSGVSTAAQVNAGVRGASSGQMSSLISIQRSMLHAILTLTGQRAHPETTYQRQTSGIDFNVATGT